MRNSPWQRANALYLEINGKSCWFFARIIYNRLFMHNHKYLYTICICICVLFSKRIALWLFLLSCVNLASRNVYKIVRIISIRSWHRVGVAFSMDRVCEWMHCLDEWIPNLLGNTTIWAWMKSEDGDCLPYRQWWPWWPLGFLVDLGGFLGGFLLIPIGGAGIGGGENLGV